MTAVSQLFQGFRPIHVLCLTNDAGGGKGDLAVLLRFLDPCVAATVAAKTGRSPRCAAPFATALAAFGRAAHIVILVAFHAVAAQYGICSAV